MKPLAAFDVDGTVFRSSLFVELTEALIRERVFPGRLRSVYAAAFLRWQNREGSYEDFVRDMIVAFEDNLVGVKAADFTRIAKKVVAVSGKRTYRFTRDLVKKLKKHGYYVVAISKSPKIILDAFCKQYGFDKVYGWIYEVDARGRLTGKILHEEFAFSKSATLKRAVATEGLTLKGSVAVGDTESDIAMLELVDRPICFNPNAALYKVAKKKKWEVVVERKDVIYSIQ